jgi:hypothetical protein
VLQGEGDGGDDRKLCVDLDRATIDLEGLEIVLLILSLIGGRTLVETQVEVLVDLDEDGVGIRGSDGYEMLE